MGNGSSVVAGSGDGGPIMSATKLGAAGAERRSEDGDGPIQGAGAGAASEAVTPDEIKRNVEDLLSQERVVIFSKESCPYCYDTKNVFDKMGQKYAVVELNQHPQGNGVQDVLNDMTGARTVPRVFIDGKCIGGGSDTVKMFKSGKLVEILSQDAMDTEGAASQWYSWLKLITNNYN